MIQGLLVLGSFLAAATSNLSGAENPPIWKPLGPAGAMNGKARTAGRVDVAVSDPRDANVMYVGGSTGGGSELGGTGIWKTTNYLTSDPMGPTWTPITDQFPSLAIFGKSLALSRTNPDILYAAASGPDGGILRTTDADAHWEYLLTDVFSSALFTALVIDPNDANIVYVAVRGASPGGSVVGGVYRLTFTPNGATAVHLTAAIAPGLVATDVVIDPTNSLILYAGLVNEGGPGKKGVYKSSDRGNTWELATKGILSGDEVGNWIALVIAPSAPATVYTTIFKPGNSGSTPSLERYRTTDGGANWSLLKPPIPASECKDKFDNVCEDFRYWHVMLSVAPNEPNTLYVNSHPEAVYLSKDSGETWTPLREDEDPINVYFDSTETAIFASDQGISRLLDPGSPAPLQARQGNLGNFQFYNFILDPHDGTRGFGISQDHLGLARYTGKDEWTFAPPGSEVGRVLIDPHDPNIVYNLAPVDSGFVQRSTDGGEIWVFASRGISPDDFSAALPAQENYNAFALDEHRPARLVLGGKRVWQTLDRGNSWTAISPELSPSPPSSPPVYITAIAIAPSRRDTIYAATQDGRFFATFDGGKQWLERDQGLPPAAAAGLTFNIAIDPAHPNRVFIQQSALAQNGRIWMTTNGGLSWSRLDAGIPANLEVFSLAADWRFKNPTLYVGTLRGLYFSTDLGANWAPYGQGLPRTYVRDLQILPSQGLLVAATMGRGVWQVPLAIPGRSFLVRARPILSDLLLSGIAFGGGVGLVRRRRR